MKNLVKEKPLAWPHTRGLLDIGDKTISRKGTFYIGVY
jgi:hypothetical protein